MDVFANHRAYWKTGISVILMLAASVPASAQSDQQKTRVFTLEEAVDFALKNYPAVRVSLERLRSAEAGVTVARTSYLPRTDVLWQSNRATDNNITGLTLPNSVIAPITGRSLWRRRTAAPGGARVDCCFPGSHSTSGIAGRGWTRRAQFKTARRWKRP